MGTSTEDAASAEPPLCFMSFPSTKDPNWKKHPGRENKATCALITMSNNDWFKKFDGTSLHKRGDDYEEMKAAMGDSLVEFACKLYPQIRGAIRQFLSIILKVRILVLLPEQTLP
jgi:all-trans-retinol 13,14-reductase